MKKKKEEYSMTAKQRKELRRASESAKPQPAEPVPEEPIVAAPEGETAVVSRRKIWIPLVCVAMALLLILGGVLLWLFVPQSTSKYPRAVITLSDGRKMTLTIWEEECPLAATNFIFLAKIGYFDNVMIHDVEPNRAYMRFGSYPSYASGAERYRDADFVEGISKKIFNIVNVEKTLNRENAAKSKFGYRLYRDTAKDASRYGEQYVLSYNYDTYPDFVINLGENNQNFTNQAGKNSFRSNLVAFAKFEDEASQKVLDDIYALTEDPDAINKNTSYDNFVGLTTPLYIRSVKVSNLNEKKWGRRWQKDKFEFVSYMNTARDGASAFRSWVGTY